MLLQPVDALTDDQITPDAGSANPFDPGADRNAAARAFTVNLIAGAPPAGSARAPNTLYNYEPVGPLKIPSNLAVLIYRVYVPDSGLDPTGGTGLPRLVFDFGGGNTVSGPQACRLPSVLDTALPDIGTIPDPLSDLPNTGAFTNLLWLKFYDLQSAEISRVFATPLGPAVYELVGSPTSGSGGFLSNQDNRYIYAQISRQLGNVVAIHGRFPRTPATAAGESPMQGGDMRYWSLCSNDGNTTAVIACLYDEQVLRDSQGESVIVVSKAGDRPANAVPQCGVSWLNWGPNNDGLLIYRNMLPEPQPEFPYAIQYVPGPPGQHEAQVMGPYYPYGSHMTRQAFEALGCPVSPGDLPSVVTPPP